MGNFRREDLGKLAQDLKPYMSGWFGYKEATSVAASGSGSLEPHGLNSTYHTGTLDYNQAPWAVTDDELAAHVADPNAHHSMVTQSDGITSSGVTQVISVRRAATSGLSFDGTGGLQLDDTVAGNGLIIASKALAINVGGNAGLTLASDALNINLASPSGLTLASNQLSVADTLAGNGLAMVSKVMNINLSSPSGLELILDALQVNDTLAGSGLSMTAKVMAINLATPSGLEIVADALALADTVAGPGLGISSKILAVNAGVGLLIASDTVALGTPTTLNTTSTNTAVGTTHTHQIDHRSNPGQASYILSTDANGELFLYRESITNRLQVPLINSAAGMNLLLQPAQYLDLDPGSNLVRMLADTSIQTDNYFSQTTGMRISYAGEGDFRYLYTDELHAKAFIADLEQALAGGQIISKSVAVLAAPFTAPSTTSTVPTITFRADAHNRTTGTTNTVTKPAGTVENDVMIALVVYYSALTINSVPSGWTLLTTQTGGSDTAIKVYYKVAGASEPASYAWGISAADDFVAIISTYYNVNTTTPIDVFGGQGGNTTTNLAAPSITTTIANTYLVYLAGFNDANVTGASATAPSGMTETDDYAGTLYSWGYVAGTYLATSGATGTKSAILATAHQYAAVLLALKPQAATAGSTTLIVEDLPSAPDMMVFEDGDIVRLREFSRAGGGLSITDCWGTVSSYVDGVTDVDGIGIGNQKWTFTRSGSPNTGAMAQGTIVQPKALVLDYGISGNGFYEVNAIDGIYGLNSPYMQIVNWTGHPHSGKTVRLRAGNLRGVFGVNDEYGLYAGNGSIAPSSAYMRLSNIALEYHNIAAGWYNGGGTQTVAIDSGGTMWLGPSSVDRRLDFDGTNLSIRGGLVVGPGLGFSTDALMYCGYDGSSIRGDTSGNPNGNMGQSATLVGAPRFRRGRYGKALETSEAATNIMANPSFEADAVGGAGASWNTHTSGTATGTRLVTDEDSWDGAKCLKVTKTGGALADQYGVYVQWPVTINVYYSMSVKVKLTNLVGQTTNLANLVSSTSLTVVSTTYNTQGEWTELRITARGTATATGRINVYLANCTTGVMYVDAAMLWAGTTSAAYYPPFWETSVARPVSYVRYNGVGIGNVTNLSISGWFWLNDSASAVGRSLNLFDMLQPDTNASYRLHGYISVANKLVIVHTIAGVALTMTGVVDVTAGAWHHIAITVNGTAVTSYLDGSIASIGTATGYLINADVLIVGALVTGTPMNGWIDDLAIIPRALSFGDVQQIYINGNPLRSMSSPYEMQIWNKDAAGSLSRIAATVDGLFGSTIDNSGVETANFGFFNDTIASWGGFSSLAAGDVVIGRSAGNYIRYTNSSGLLSIKGAIQITSGSSGIGSFTDAGPLVAVTNLDGVPDGSTYHRTTVNEAVGAARAYSALDAANALITRVDPANNWGANPGAGVAGLLLGGDYMGYWSGSAWKSYMDSTGKFYLNSGAGTDYLSWDGTTLTVSGTIVVEGGNAATLGNVTGAINLVFNSSFELDTTNDGALGIADGFAVYNNDGGTVPTTASIVAGERSTWAQRVSWTGTNLTTKGIYFYTGSHVANKAYMLTFWCRTNTSIGIELAHNVIPTKVNIIKPTANSTWQFFAIKCTWSTTQGDAWYITINPGQAVANGWVDFDNIMVYEGDTVVPYSPAPTDQIGYGGLITMPSKPVDQGLYLTSDQMGYWNGSTWALYMTSGGSFYFGGATGASLRWNGSKLSGYNSSNIEQWYAGSTTGQIVAGGDAITLDANGVTANVSASNDNKRMFRFTSGGSLIAGLRANKSGSTTNIELGGYFPTFTHSQALLLSAYGAGVGTSGTAMLRAQQIESGSYAEVQAYADGSGDRISFIAGPAGGQELMRVQGSSGVYVYSNLNVSYTVYGANFNFTSPTAAVGTLAVAANASNYAYQNFYYAGTRMGYMMWTNTPAPGFLQVYAEGRYLSLQGTRVGVNRTDPVYAFDVAGEQRTTGTIRTDVALSLLPQGAAPGVSAAYGILYVNASNQLCYIKKNGTSPGTVIVP